MAAAIECDFPEVPPRVFLHDGTRAAMEQLYAFYNSREFVHPDPLEFLYDYENPLDREIVGMVASSLAYGRVGQILKSVSAALSRMSHSPAAFILENGPASIDRSFRGFRHRFTAGDDLAGLLKALRKVILRHGSLQSCFRAGLKENDTNILAALGHFVCELGEEMGQCRGMFIPSPQNGSACKRLNLFLRWMVRSDAVDPGGWNEVRPASLVVPLDTHMHRIGLDLGLTRRKQADMQAALEITQAFKRIVPEDPVRYDFALTRLGIRMGFDQGFGELIGAGTHRLG